jgi:hypothetical protein
MSTAGLTHLPVSGTVRSPTIDYSSLRVLADCQWQWYENYVVGTQTEPTAAMKLGTLLGEACAEFYAGRPWEEPVLATLKEWQKANPEADYTPEWIEKAHWLMVRYSEHYADDRKEVVQIGAEIPFRLRLPHRYGWLVGRIDEVWLIDGRTWIVERKSSKDFSKLDSGLFMVDPQTSLYYWAARQLGYDPWGICIDFIRTYKWTRDLHKHPPADSFRREFYDRNDEHLRQAIREAGKGLSLAKLLIGGTLQPLRNINDHCGWCQVRNQCVADLAFEDQVVPATFEMEV